MTAVMGTTDTSRTSVARQPPGRSSSDARGPRGESQAEEVGPLAHGQGQVGPDLLPLGPLGLQAEGPPGRRLTSFLRTHRLCDAEAPSFRAGRKRRLRIGCISNIDMVVL